MKNIFILTLLALTFACASKPKINTATFADSDGEVSTTLNGYPPLTAQYEFEGHKVALKECSFLRTIFLDLAPVPTGNFAKSLKKRIEPKTIMGVYPAKSRKQTNPCSRVGLFTSMKNIRNLGAKGSFGDLGYLARGSLGIAPEGQAYLELTFFEKDKKNELVKVMYPGYFLTYEQAQDMTDDELAEWIVTTVYHAGWK
ncbi:MAG: hypothetical protein H0V66_16025 [Bdellovibrionales bacterium]|nr:hypothetical protein [Bdellovibrionales bacterium]